MRPLAGDLGRHAALPDPKVWAALMPARGDRQAARAALVPTEEVVGELYLREGRAQGAARRCASAPAFVSRAG